MEINTNEPLNIMSQLLIPIVLILITCIIQEPLKKYLSLREKSQYIKLLRSDFPSILNYLRLIIEYKFNSFYFSLLFILFGLILGAYITQYLYYEVVLYLIDYWFSNFSYIQTVSYIDNIEPMDIELITCTCLNCVILFISWVLTLYIFFLDHLFKPQLRSDGKIKRRIRYICNSLLKPIFKQPLTSDGKIKGWIKYVYASHWLLIGYLLGIYMLIYSLIPYYLQTYSIEYLYDFSDHEYNYTYFFDIYNSMKINLPYFQYIEYIFALGLIYSVGCFLIAYSINRLLSYETIETITYFYQNSFPYIKIKTGNGEIEGQIKEIRNKSLITLSEKNVLTLVPWDKIEIMEAMQPVIYEYAVHDIGSIKDERQAEQQMTH